MVIISGTMPTERIDSDLACRTRVKHLAQRILGYLEQMDDTALAKVCLKSNSLSMLHKIFEVKTGVLPGKKALETKSIDPLLIVQGEELTEIL